MGGSPDIFARLRLTPDQLRTVAQRRFDDAMCLLHSRDRARLNGAMYMGGFVVECLLKSMILERHPNLEKGPDPAALSATDRRANSLLYSHDLDLMLDALPEIESKFTRRTDIDGRAMFRRLRGVCEEWTVYARYSARIARPEDAKRFLDTIHEVKKWLKEL